jgi:hypothetical protein
MSVCSNVVRCLFASEQNVVMVKILRFRFVKYERTPLCAKPEVLTAVVMKIRPRGI